ncbi:CDP-glycerol glycerophosphotransferase family protein [Glutamicibacter sp. NPDC087344]|uniref:CDP-glycerol glycerophosphotransferase family protein n=1 Tax=Glutamicibacter sp. NPDC087344 TaxID=3363994 RepID=UPI00382A941D
MNRQLHDLTKRLKRYLRDDLHFRSKAASVDNKMVLFESFDGSSQSCHPLAIFEYMLNAPEYANFKFIWSYRGSEPTGYTWDKYKQKRNIIWANHGSLAYFYYLSKSKYLVSNSTFPHQFTKKENQIYLNTWHGIPLKKMGYDIPLGIPSTRNVIRNLVASDYILSASSLMTEKIWDRAFKLRGIYGGKIIEAGSPRMDAQISNQTDVKLLRKNLGIDHTDHREIVLFAPTWRGTSPSDIIDSSQQLAKDCAELIQGLNPREYIVLLKVHQLALRKIDQATLANIGIIDNSIPTNQILPAVDQLITDESSIVFDFLIENRPIHFYFPDSALDGRGMYVLKSELPGTVSSTIADTIAHIANPVGTEDLKNLRKAWTTKYLPLEDGNATKRVVDAVFQDENEHLRDTPIETDASHKKILLHVGSLIPNGISTAAVNFANQLAADGHDVSILYPYSKKEHQLSKVYEFSDLIRHFPRVGSIALPLTSRRAYRRYLSEGGRTAKNVNMSTIREIFKHEWVRCFGDSTFDTIIAFDGYSVFWAELLLAANSNSKYIWMHNDLMQDAKRTINGKMPHYKNLSSLFSLYNSFDKIVSVSPELTEINRAKMSAHAPREKFVTVQNFIDQDEVLRLSEEYRNFVPPKTGKNFVTVGRLSPEKNQSRMIRAMKIVTEIHPDSNLYIIGDGPLYSNLEALISSLSLKDNVHLLGYHRNPHALVKKCDYFAFSSKYEGQGLAVIEAMVLGKPVVTTRYNVVDSVVGPEDGIITENTDESLAEGMLKMILSGGFLPNFSPTKHNDIARSETRNLIRP